jgi:ribosome biogenesis GTPase / thiamine phosphate phosphatase
MNLNDLGFDSWFEAQAADCLQPGHAIARVTAVDRGRFLVRDERRAMGAELSGRFFFNVEGPGDLPCVGDWVGVELQNQGTSAIIHDLLPRKTFLRRKSAGKSVDFQMIAANIDTAFIVQACPFDINLNRFDRYLVMANDGGIEPILLLTKIDLISPAELERMLVNIRQSGIPGRVLLISNTTGAGFEEFQKLLLPGRTYGLLGSSGVGKTTIINRLLGREAFKIREVSGTGEGTHTTARRQLVLLDQGAMFVDTPGMRELGLVGAGDGLDLSFEDIRLLAAECRFLDCRHGQEPGCAVRAAVETGAVSEERYRSYIKLRKESEYHEMSYVDKRKKDRAFGRHIKSSLKIMKK